MFFSPFIYILLINFMVRIAPRLNIPYYGDDTWSYLSLADHIRKRDKVSDFYDCVIINEECCDPLFLSKFLSYFPKRIVERYQFLFSPLFDTLNLTVLLWLSLYLYHSTLITVLTGIFYIFYYPVLVQALSLNTRTLGYLVFNAAAISLLFWFREANIGFMALFMVSAALILNTNRMATQAFLFLILGLSIFYKKPYLILLLPAIFLLALIFSRGQYLKVIKGHMLNVVFHFKSIFSSQISKYPSGTYRSAIFKLLSWGGIVLFLSWQSRSGTEVFLYLWALIFLFTFVATTFIKPLRCIGEGYRYLDYSIIPVSILFAKALVTGGEAVAFAIFTAYMALAILQIIKHYRSVKCDYINIIDQDRLKVFEFLRNAEKKKVFCLPNGMSHATIYFTGKKVLWVYFAWHNLPWLFPQLRMPPKVSLDKIVGDYKLDYILLHSGFACAEELRLRGYKVALRQGEYYLLDVS